MLILIKDYSFVQTDEAIIITVPLKYAYHKKADIFTSDHYLKINSPPFLFEACLWAPVVETDSTCTFGNDQIIFSLMKQIPEIWPSLTADLTRQEALQVKIKAIEEAQEKAQNRQKENAEKKDKRQKNAVREQINLNTKEIEYIKQTREQERKEALAALGMGPKRSSVTITELEDDKPIKSKNKEIFLEKKKSKSITDFKLPAPREAAQIDVSFTPRWFPTPGRESKIAEEQEWLSKRAEAARKTGFIAEDLRPEEQDPIWLCDKAQGFYDVGNYKGAVSAYNHALTLNSHMYELYAGRAVAHLALGNHNRCLLDASKALELLTPPVAQNAVARARCLLSRGTALAALGMRTEALGELNAAKKLTPDCRDIKDAISQLHLKS